MEHIRKAFDAVAAEYDAQREHVIPDMRNYYSAAVWAAESPSHTPAILDIGAGTGLLTALLLEKYPAANVTLLDIAEKMLAVARERFSGRENVCFRAGDYAQVDLGGPYDLACSALSIHHLDPGDKRRLFGGCTGPSSRAGFLSMPTRPKERRLTSRKGTASTGMIS